MQTNKQIHEISQSEPEHDKSFFGAPRITCGLLSKWANSGSLKNDSRPSFGSSSVYFRTDIGPFVSCDVLVDAAANGFLLALPFDADRLTDAINSFSSNLRRSSGNNSWLLCDVLLILFSFGFGLMCFGLLWPLLWTIGSASVLLVLSSSVWAFMGTFSVLRAWISISFSILFKRFISDICELKWKTQLCFIRTSTMSRTMRNENNQCHSPCNCIEVRSLAMCRRFVSAPPERFRDAVDIR